MTTLVVTLWSTLGALEQSGEAIARMAKLAAEASGAEIVLVDHSTGPSSTCRGSREPLRSRPSDPSEPIAGEG